MGMAFDVFLPAQRRLAEEPMVYVLRPAAAAFFPINRKVNNQRLCLPRIPAFVRCFSIEDLLNTRSRVICSSFVSLE